MLPRLEKGLVVLIPSPWRGQVLAKQLHHIASHRNKSGFVELCPPDGDHTIVEIHVCQAQPQRFSHSHTRSVEEQQQGSKRNCRCPARYTSLTTRRCVQQQTKLPTREDIWNEGRRMPGNWRG
jgi:hypothetical protein